MGPCSSEGGAITSPVVERTRVGPYEVCLSLFKVDNKSQTWFHRCLNRPSGKPTILVNVFLAATQRYGDTVDTSRHTIIRDTKTILDYAEVLLSAGLLRFLSWPWLGTDLRLKSFVPKGGRVLQRTRGQHTVLCSHLSLRCSIFSL